MKNRFSIFVFLFTSIFVRSEMNDELVVLLVTQPHIYFLSQIETNSPLVPILHTHSFDASVSNSFTIYPIFPSILRQFSQMKWLFIGEIQTRIRLDALLDFLHSQSNRSIYVGHALYDAEPSIIHHYSFDLKTPYPDFGPGLVVSRDILTNLTERLKTQKNSVDFIIDVKFELNRLINDLTSMKLDDRPDLFCYENRSTCLTSIDSTVGEFSCRRDEIQLDQFFFGIKTFVDFHSTRIPLMKKTWLNENLKYKFFTNVVNVESNDRRFVSTNENTERGHCHKTFFIFNYFNRNETNERFLIVADDDTLISVSRLLRAVRCLFLSDDSPLVVGERYAYGEFYPYPTGGSAMIFNRRAVEKLVDNCRCPSPDTPDDMFIGMCLKRLEIPLIHLYQMHQAQPSAYASDWLKNQKSISFHKFDGIDVEKTFREFLYEKPDEIRTKDEF